MNPIKPAVALLALAGLAACADPATSVPSATANPTPAQRTRDTLGPPRGPAESAGRAIDRAANPTRPWRVLKRLQTVRTRAWVRSV